MSQTPHPATLQWDIEEVDIEEGSQFYNTRLEAVPEEWFTAGVLVADSQQAITDLFNWVFTRYRYDRIRVYFQHRDNYELFRIRPNDFRANFVTTRTQVFRSNLHVMDIATATYNQLILMSDRYDDDEANLLDDYVVIIDLHVVPEHGACGNGQFPRYFAECYNRDTIYNPSGRFCALKCLYYHFRRSAPPSDEICLAFAREHGLPLDTDDMHHSRLGDAVCDVFHDLRFLVVDLQLNVVFKAQGAEWIDNTLVVLLSGAHYFYIRDYDELVRQRWGSEARACLQCGRIVGGSVVAHECIRVSVECGKCGKHFGSKYQRSRHKPPKSGYTSPLCEGCGERDFVSAACYGYHTSNCAAYKHWRREANDQRAQEREKVRGARIHCAGCGKFYYENVGKHACYFERLPMPEEPKYPDGIYVFDFESMFSEPDAYDAYTHTVNYVVVKKLFDDSFSKHFDTLDAFVGWLATVATEKALVLAHNFRGYDGRLLLAKLLATPGEYCENFITVASKLNSFTYGNLTFSDSLLHIAQPLDQFPKIFGLPIECKGFFPYEFNVAANQNYVGAIPAVEQFRPGKMSEKRRAAFLRWYDEVKTQPYDFRAEMVKYCDLDVEIMKRGLEVYIRSSQQANSNINPLESFTIAASAYRIWRTLHMPERVIAYYGQAFHEAARASLRGGRTDVRCLYKKWTPHQVFVERRYGVYADVQSMYPYIQMTKPLPVGKPVRVYGEYQRGDFGIVKCDLLPPIEFPFHPAICVRDPETDRLCAPLTPLNNVFITTVELEQAIAQGYRVKKIHFVDKYEQSDTLFRDYIRTFLKIKVEKSQDYPGDEKFRQLYDMYWTRCGIQLEAANFENNPGLKQIAKLYLNSLWGKLCQRPQFDFTQHVSLDDFLRLEEEEELGLYDPKLKLKINDDSWFVRGKYTQKTQTLQLQENRRKVSPAIGSFITMYGRTMLLEQMERLGKRVLYHDTDSIVYERREGDYNIPLGKCLGDWEDELGGKPMIEFVALAPKTYSYRYLDTPDPNAPAPFWECPLTAQRFPVREVTKIKGVKQCYDTKTSIDFDTMLKLVQRTQDDIKTEQLFFNWNVAEMKMTTRYIEKRTSFRYGKGVVGGDYFTYPPGVEQYWDEATRSCEQGALINL